MQEARKILIILLIYYLNTRAKCDNYSSINLPPHHLSYYFNNFPKIREECLSTEDCEFREFLESGDYERDKCWGYEDNCPNDLRFSRHRCPGDYVGYVKTKEIQLDSFFTQADFGFVKQQRKEMEIICEPLFIHDSSLECSKNLKFCRGRNIMVNFTDLATRFEPIRYKTDVLKQGQIGGFCKLYKERLENELDHLSALQSWAPELRYFEKRSSRPIEEGICDVVIEKPTIFMKIDATTNMYHHFCDFFNLYASQHVNYTHPFVFNTDINILVWESYTYNSPFAKTFEAFTSNPILDLKTFRGEVVCFKNLVLPLLPRMIFGLYYNTPIMTGCENSGLFQAFSEHILHRLKVTTILPTTNKIRVTLISRQTKYRRIVNEKQLVDAIRKDSRYEVRQVAYDKDLTFAQQLKITRNTDVLIGMHGAGLTHLMFLPNWATIFELYHCEDPNCYSDLARLRGVNYITWEDDELLETVEQEMLQELGAHPKFANYRFDVDEFVRLVAKGADHVIENDEFQDFIAGRAVNTVAQLKEEL